MQTETPRFGQLTNLFILEGLAFLGLCQVAETATTELAKGNLRIVAIYLSHQHGPLRSASHDDKFAKYCSSPMT